METCRYSSSVEHQLPKLGRRVRFPLSALRKPETLKNQCFRLFLSKKYSIYLPGEPGDVLSPNPSTLRKVVIIMSTYEELSLIVSIALLIVAILNYTHKK